MKVLELTKLLTDDELLSVLDDSEQLDVLTDGSLYIFKSSEIFYAVVVEDNGDEFELTRGTSVSDIYVTLKEIGFAKRK